MSVNMKRRVIDKRKSEKYLKDDAYLNGQARLCGWQATLVYDSLCRHASKIQESFPSIKLMSEELAVSRPTIIKGLKNLEKHSVIQVQKKRTKDGRWLNNTYILIDKSEWIRTQVNEIDTAIQVNESKDPSKRELTPKSTSFTLRKHIEGNTYKETHNNSSKEELGQKSYGHPLINKFLSYLEEKAEVIDTPKKYQRTDSWILISKMKALARKKKGGEPTDDEVWNGLKFIVDSACQDKFHSQRSGNIKYLYNNIGAIVKSNQNNKAVII